MRTGWFCSRLLTVVYLQCCQYLQNRHNFALQAIEPLEILSFSSNETELVHQLRLLINMPIAINSSSVQHHRPEKITPQLFSYHILIITKLVKYKEIWEWDLRFETEVLLIKTIFFFISHFMSQISISFKEIWDVRFETEVLHNKTIFFYLISHVSNLTSNLSHLFAIFSPILLNNYNFERDSWYQANLEQMPVAEILENINKEDRTVPFAVAKSLFWKVFCGIATAAVFQRRPRLRLLNRGRLGGWCFRSTAYIWCAIWYGCWDNCRWR